MSHTECHSERSMKRRSSFSEDLWKWETASCMQRSGEGTQAGACLPRALGMWEATRLQHLQLLHRWRACLLLSGPRQNQSPCCGYSCSCQVTIQLQSPQAPQREQLSSGSLSRPARPVSELGSLSLTMERASWPRRAGVSCSLHFPSRVPCRALQLLNSWLSITSPWAFLHPGAGAVPRSQPPPHPHKLSF